MNYTAHQTHAAESLSISNLIPNSSFESDSVGQQGAPSQWSWSGPKEIATIESDKPISNFGNSLHLDFREVKRSDNIWYAFSEYIPIDNTRSYLQSGWIKTGGDYKGFGASIVRRFYDADKQLISKPIDQKFLARNASPREWQYYSQQIVPQRKQNAEKYADDEIPPNARYMKIGLLAMYYPHQVWFSGLRLEQYSPAAQPLSHGDNKIIFASHLPSDQTIKVDGEMDDAWRNLGDWKSTFTRTIVEEDQITALNKNEQTRFKVIQGRKNTYLFIQCYTPEPDKIKATITDHNDIAVFSDDCVEIFLDATGNRSEMLHLGVNPNGAYYEEWLRRSVNLNLEVATKRNEDGWQAEIAIPHDKLWQIYNEAGYDINDGMWNINIARHAPNAESRYSSWAYTGRSFHNSATLGFLLLKDYRHVLLDRLTSDNQQLQRLKEQVPDKGNLKALEHLKSTFNAVIDYNDAAQKATDSATQISAEDFAHAFCVSHQSIGTAKDILEEIKRLMVELPDDRKSYGYAIYKTPFFERPKEDRIPSQNEIISKVDFQMARNEPAQYSFSIYSKENLKDVEISWEDLKDKRGNIIPEKDIDIRILEPWGDLNQADILATDLRMELQGWLSNYSQEKRFIPQITEDTSRKLWININAKLPIKEGTYKGNIIISPSNKPVTTVPFEITVLPFELPQTNKRVGFFFHGVLASENQPPLGQPAYMFYNGLTSPDEYLRELKALRQAGFTMMSLVDYANGPLDAEYTRQILSIAKEAGFESIALVGSDHLISPTAMKMPEKLPEKKEILRQRLKKVYEIADELKIPNLYIFGADEPYTEEGYERNRVIADVVHEIGGKTTVAMIFLSAYNAIHDEIDLPIMSWGRVTSNPEAVERYQAAQKSGKEIMYYGNLVADQTLLSRYTFGQYLYKSKFAGNLVWAYYYLGLDWDPFPEKGFSPTAYYVIPTKDDPIPTLKFESAKAGVTDLRYFELLEQLINQNKNKTVAGEVQKEFDELLQSVSIVNQKGTNNLQDSLSVKEFDDARTKIQQLILKIQK